MDKRKWAIVGVIGFIILAIIIICIVVFNNNDNKKEQPKQEHKTASTGLKEKETREENNQKDKQQQEKKEQPKQETKKESSKTKKPTGVLSSKPNTKNNNNKPVKNVKQSKDELEDNAKTFMQYTTMPQIESKGTEINENLRDITSEAFQNDYLDGNSIKHPIENEIGPFDYKTNNYDFKWLTKNINKDTKNAEAVVSYTSSLKTTGNQPKDKQMYQEHDNRVYIKFVREHGKLVIDQTRM